MTARRGANAPEPSGRVNPVPPEAHRRIATALAMGTAAVFAGVASGATPFTASADVAVSVPSALFVGTLVAGLRSGGRRRDRAHPAGGGGSAIPWIFVVVLLVAVELASFFHSGPRADYPTLSSGMTALFHDRAARAAGWFVWLTVGWYLARR